MEDITPETPARTGPLAGLRVIEMAGLGPVPLAGLMLSEMGARVLRIERAESGATFLPQRPEFDLDRHGRDILRLDLKQPQARDLVLRLAEKADCLMEGFRPGVMERLGLGPEEAMARNRRLVYARMTGFGQDGPLAARAGHDLTYLAYSGVLHAIGRKGERPVPPLNLVADYGGGTMMLLTGMMAALWNGARTGQGQVVDVAMVEGASMLAAPFFGFMASGFWRDRRGENLLDSGAPFYETYETADGGHVAVACLEPQFFAQFCALLPLDEEFARGQYDQRLWPAMREAITSRFKSASRDEWASLFEPTDACVAPVLSLAEAAGHPHARAREAHARVGTMVRPRPAPRFSRTPTVVSGPARNDTGAALAGFGIEEDEIARLADAGVLPS